MSAMRAEGDGCIQQQRSAPAVYSKGTSNDGRIGEKEFGVNVMNPGLPWYGTHITERNRKGGDVHDKRVKMRHPLPIHNSAGYPDLHRILFFVHLPLQLYIPGHSGLYHSCPKIYYYICTTLA
jgi:hypothetical protein